MAAVVMPLSKMEGGSSSGTGTGQRTSCDSCKRSKLKCIKDPWSDKCTRCIARNTECQVTLVSRKKREKKIHYLSAIEDRMKRMESAMNASGITIDDQIEPAIPNVNAQSASLEDKLSIFVISDDGASGFVGASSGFSLFSPQGLRWISEKTGNTDFEQTIKEVTNHCDTALLVQFPVAFRPLPENEMEPLPPKELATEYMTAFFSAFNSAFPLYDKEMVLERFEKDYYTASPQQDVAWYASLNVIFLIGRAIARRERGADVICERYFHNASSVFTELLFNGPSLLAVQAMIGMAFVMQAGEDPHPSYVLAGTACRLAQAIGLHRRLDGYGLTPKEIEQRRNVFWIALGLEKGISIRSGRPSVFSDDDIGVELPEKILNANNNLAEPDSVLDTFRSVATLALLESRVYSKLYSARSHTKSEIERLKWVGALDKELQQWRDDLPILIRPEHPIKCHTKHLMHVIMIHFAYYNCLVAIHRGSVHHGSWINTKKPKTVRDAKNLSLNPRVFESGSICLTAARQVIGLLHHYNSNDNHDLPNLGVVSMCNYYPLTASLTLFANILQNPSAPTALSDLALMHCVTSILINNFTSASNPRSAIHLQIFKQIIRVAAQFAAKARNVPPDTYLDVTDLPMPAFAITTPTTSPSPSTASDSAAATPSSSEPPARVPPASYVPCRGFQLPFSTPSPASPQPPHTEEGMRPPYLASQPAAPYRACEAQIDAFHAHPHKPEQGAPGGPAILPSTSSGYSPDYSDIGPGAAAGAVDLNAFDFNSYQWQGSEAGFPGLSPAGQEYGGQVQGGGGADELAGFGDLNGGMAEGNFMPMVFQWDLADIWQGRDFGSR